jgi:hypothetical protein
MKFSTQIKWNGGRVIADMNSSRDAGARKALDHLLKTSQRQVPVGPSGKRRRPGALKRSGKVIMDGDGKGSVQYGTTGPTAKYAIVQHERMDFNHPRGGNAKYLERPMVSEAGRMLQIIADEVRRSIR